MFSPLRSKPKWNRGTPGHTQGECEFYPISLTSKPSHTSWFLAMLKSVVTPEKSQGKLHFDTLAPFASLLLSVIKSRTLGREGFGSLSPYTTEKRPQHHLYTRAVGNQVHGRMMMKHEISGGGVAYFLTKATALRYGSTPPFASLPSIDPCLGTASAPGQASKWSHLPSRTQEVHQQPWHIKQN